MKKIYMILAAIALLTLSLNAQMLPSSKFKAVNKTHITDNGKGQQANNNGRPFRAPSKLNSDEFLVGPYTTDYFSTTGIGLYNSITSGRMEVSTIIPRADIEQYIGQEIVGYRFATVGGTVSCYSFFVEGEGPNSWIDDLYYWNINSDGSYYDLSGTQWHEFYLDEPVVFQVPDTTQSIWIGYKYWQESSNNGNYTMTPIAVNPNVTNYDCAAYSYSNQSFYNVTSIFGGALAAQLIFKSTTNPEITITPATQTINDAATGALTVTGTDIEGNISVSAGNDWYLNPTSLSNTGGNVNVSYTGRALSASTTVTASATGATDATATVNYVADLYIVTDNGVTGNWDFTNGTQMTNNNGIYTATFTATADNTYILFARMLGNGVGWNTRYVFGPDSNGDWVWGDFTGGNIDVNDDDPIKLPAGTYTVTINANDGTFTITKLAPELTAPVDGSTVNVGTNYGSGVSQTIPVNGNYLTGDLTVSVTGDGFSVSPTTISAADANAGTSVTVTYNGTNPNATGTLTITSSNGEVSTVNVNLTASYIAPTPELTAPTDGSTVNVGTNTGTGVSQTITVSGEHLTGDLTISVDGAYFTVEPTTISAADANASTTITVTYNGYSANATGTLTITSSNGEVDPVTVNLTASFSAQPADPVTGLLRMHLLMVDQLKANIPDDNTHADKYRYVLKYEPQGEAAKESTPVTVDILKTECKVEGYWTKSQIDADTDAGLTMDVLTANVEFDLSDDNDMIEFYELQGLDNDYPALKQNYMTKLQQTTGFTYVEMLEGPNKEQEYESGIHHYYDQRSPILTGVYGTNFMTYAPSVSTWGIQRRYYEEDHEDNTYGAPIWRTGVGKVTVSNPAIQKQVINAGTPNEAPNPYTTWTADGKTYCIFFVGTSAEGYLPKPYSTENINGTNIKYEPYMFRVFVQSPTGKLRNFTEKANVHDDGTTDYSPEDAGAIAANQKFCVGSFKLESGTWHSTDQDDVFFFNKAIPVPTSLSLRDGGSGDDDEEYWNGAMKFAAEENITKDDIKVFVRFYYMTEGWSDTRDGDERPGNGSEGSGDPGAIGTYVYEFFGNAEVVGVTYVNAQGMTSNKPFDGLNIVVTRYSDGTTSTTKVMR